MKELNQYILCSVREGQGYVRELAVFDELAVVVGINPLPYGFHRIVDKTRDNHDIATSVDVPIYHPHRYGFCVHCGNQHTFTCSKCKLISCRDPMEPKHRCPGCKKSYETQPADSVLASNSGLISELSEASKKKGNYADALWRLIDRRNKQDA